MRVLVVGGEGFIGQALVARLRRGAGIGGAAASLITVLDQRIPSRAADPKLRYVEGDIGEPAVLARAIEGGVDCVFHLASIPGGASEQNFELGLRVNLHASLNLLEVLRNRSWCSQAASASMAYRSRRWSMRTRFRCRP
jgi:D-erythronate 2-dehydrogenase